MLAWRLSNTLEAEFCVESSQAALRAGRRQPRISNTDQGSQFTCAAFVEAVQAAQVAVSMAGRGLEKQEVDAKLAELGLDGRARAETLDLKQHLRVTNVATRRTADARVVWKGSQRSDGWDVGVELKTTDYDFWGVEL